MKKLNRKLIFTLVPVALTIFSATAIACSGGLQSELSKEQREKILSQISTNLINLSLSSKNTFATIDDFYASAKGANNLDLIKALLDDVSQTQLNTAFSKATFLALQSSSLSSTDVTLNIKISYDGDDVSRSTTLKIKYVSPTPQAQGPLLTTNQKTAIAWYNSIWATNTASFSFTNTLPSQVKVINAGILKNTTPTIASPFVVNYNLVSGSVNDDNGSLKIKIVLSIGTDHYKSDGSIVSSIEQADGKEVMVSGFKNLAQNDLEKAVAYYQTLPSQTQIPEGDLSALMPSKVTLEKLNTYLNSISGIPTGFTLTNEIVKNSADDEKGELSAKIVLTKDKNYYLQDGSNLRVLSDSVGKTVKISGFKKKQVEVTTPVLPGQPGSTPSTPGGSTTSGNPNEPGTTGNPGLSVTPGVPGGSENITKQAIQIWYLKNPKLINVNQDENHILPSSVTLERLKKYVTNLIVAPTDGYTYDLRIVSADDTKGTLILRLSLKKGDVFYTTEGEESRIEVGQDITVSQFETHASLSKFTKEAYAEEFSMAIKSQLTALQALQDLNKNVLPFFANLTHKLSLKENMKLNVRKANFTNSVNGENGWLTVNIYLSYNNSIFFKQDGTIVNNESDVDGKNIELEGFTKISIIDDLAKQINNWKLKDGLTFEKAKEFRKLIDAKLDFNQIIALLNETGTSETKITAPTTHLDFTTRSNLLYWEIKDGKTQMVFDATLVDKRNASNKREVKFRVDFNGYLPIFLTLTSLEQSVNDKVLIANFFDFKDGNTYQNWSNFIRNFAKANKNDEQKLINFANAMQYVISQKATVSTSNFNLLYPFNPKNLPKHFQWEPQDVIVISLLGKREIQWMGSNKNTLVIGGLQNNLGSSDAAKGEPWDKTTSNGTNANTFFKYNNQKYYITDERGHFTTTATATVKNSSAKSPFNGGIAVATMLLLKTIISG
ncbi:lipoprotein 17-related variable surface protein [Mycoplasmopsis agassizii]|uniref:lipoprotein 17-related variable surface protein n=1 Tax=Mycoplasmopsis agassizii TaxID=33922 RepID=UPI003528257A